MGEKHEEEASRRDDKLEAAEAAREAAALAAINIARYLELHGPGTRKNVMQIHEEQYSKEAEMAAELAEKNIRRFLEAED